MQLVLLEFNLNVQKYAYVVNVGCMLCVNQLTRYLEASEHVMKPINDLIQSGFPSKSWDEIGSVVCCWSFYFSEVMFGMVVCKCKSLV